MSDSLVTAESRVRELARSKVRAPGWAVEVSLSICPQRAIMGETEREANGHGQLKILYQLVWCQKNLRFLSCLLQIFH